jgi:hypothetical protein
MQNLYGFKALALRAAAGRPLRHALRVSSIISPYRSHEMVLGRRQTRSAHPTGGLRPSDGSPAH